MCRLSLAASIWGVVVCAAGAGGCGGDAGPAPALLSGVVAVSAGGDHACALLADATARCWGDDAFGELGDGRPNNDFQRAPRAVALSGIAAIAAGGGQTCALTADGVGVVLGQQSVGRAGRSIEVSLHQHAHRGSRAHRHDGGGSHRTRFWRLGIERGVLVRAERGRPGILLGR